MARIVLYRGPHKGLWVAGPRETMPEGTLRRARGVHPVATRSIRTRHGSLSVHSLVGVHSLFRFGDVRFQGAGTVLYRAGSSILTGLSGARLAFVRMPPTIGLEDYLFVTGGGLMRKVGSDGAVTNWGIAAPSDGFTATMNSALSRTIDAFDSGAWTDSGIIGSPSFTASPLAEGTNCLEVPMSSSGPGSVKGTLTKSITVDLSTYASGETSPDEDWIAFYLRMDKARKVESIQLSFSLGDTTFNTNYTRDIIIDDRISRTLTLKPEGLADLAGVHGQEAAFLASPASTPFRLSATELLGVTKGIESDDAFVRLLLPKTSFVKSGSGTETWADVEAVRFVFLVAPNSQPTVYLDKMELLGGFGLQGNYKYRVTFRNTTTGTRSNANPTPVAVTGNLRRSVALADLPISTDPQVDQREVWRTLGNGEVYFRCLTVDDNVTTTATDEVADYAGLDSRTDAELLDATELPDDNDPPAATYLDAFGPYLGRMWWCRDSADGGKGRVYYSPVARAEAVQGFLDVTDDDDPLQKGVTWNGSGYVFSESRLFEILGSGPEETLVSREVFGVPGTTHPHTVVATPYGIAYQAEDGVRVFNGSTSRLVAPEGVQVLFRGEDAGQLAAFEGVSASFGNDEYLIGDGDQALAVNLATGVWRDIGLALDAVYFEPDAKLWVVSTGTAVLNLEAEGHTTDAGTAIPFHVETAGIAAAAGSVGLVQRLYLEANTNGQAVTPTLLMDNGTQVLPLLVTAAQDVVEYPVGATGRIIGLRLEANATSPIEIVGIEADVHLPTGRA